MQSFNPLISIIIPVYNGSNYMKEAIDSALSQTYQNTEIIVVNDGSNDDGATEKIARSYGDKIRYFAKPNGGVSSALNLAIGKMRGEYFSWLSHDDLYHPEKLSYQIGILKDLEDKHTILYGAYTVINHKSQIVGEINSATEFSKSQLNTPLLPLFRGIIHGCSTLISKKWFEEVGKFDESLKSTQDYRLWFDFLHQAKIYFCNTILISSRWHEEQGSKKIPNVNTEGNDLWIKFLTQTTKEKMRETEGSCYAFYKRAEYFLKKTPYQDALSYAKKKSEEFWGESLISIIIPVYNRVELSIKAVKSALAQTYNNIEIIVVNDGSTDDITDLKKLCESYKNVRYFKQKNKGRSAARNFAIQKSKGDYIAFLDADDLLKPKKLELQLKKMVEDDTYISHTSYNRIDKDSNIVGVMRAPNLKGDVFSQIANLAIATPTILLRKSLLEQHNFREDVHYGEDVCLWIDLLHENKLSYLDIPLTDVLFSEDNTVQNIELYFKGNMNIINHIIETKNLQDCRNQLGELLVTTGNMLFDGKKSKGLYRPMNLLYKLRANIRMYGFVQTIKKIFRIIKNSIF